EGENRDRWPCWERSAHRDHPRGGGGIPPYKLLQAFVRLAQALSSRAACLRRRWSIGPRAGRAPALSSSTCVSTERNTMTRFRCLAAGLLSMLVLGRAPVAQAQDKVRLSVLPFSESLGAVIADKQGFFKAEGLEVEFKLIGSGAE